MQPSEPTATCAIRFHRAGAWQGPAADHVALAYDARFLRRKRLVGAAGVSFLVDLAQVASLSDGDAFELSDGQMIAIQAAPEDVVMIRGIWRGWRGISAIVTHHVKLPPIIW